MKGEEEVYLLKWKNYIYLKGKCYILAILQLRRDKFKSKNLQ